ncbi:MAG TPA: response regulator [Spirochaetia bacterium]|nr:response regulator [Spirochaetia bacterium]
MKNTTLSEKTILLVEDEEEVREIVGLILRSQGARLVSARSAEEAILLANRCSAPIDLIISDMIMPGMNGPELVGRLSESHPDAPVLYISGYPETEFRNIEGRQRVRFLGKPFLPDELIYNAKELIHGETSPSETAAPES